MYHVAILLPQPSLQAGVHPQLTPSHQPQVRREHTVSKLIAVQHSGGCIRQTQDSAFIKLATPQANSPKFLNGGRKQTQGFITWLPLPPAEIEWSCSLLKANFISVGKRTFQDQPISGTWVSPSHIKPRGRRGISGGTLFLQGSTQAPRHTCTEVLGICFLQVLEEVGKQVRAETYRHWE